MRARLGKAFCRAEIIRARLFFRAARFAPSHPLKSPSGARPAKQRPCAPAPGRAPCRGRRVGPPFVHEFYAVPGVQCWRLIRVAFCQDSSIQKIVGAEVERRHNLHQAIDIHPNEPVGESRCVRRFLPGAGRKNSKAGVACCRCHQGVMAVVAWLCRHRASSFVTE